jgi:hypothetical protein
MAEELSEEHQKIIKEANQQRNPTQPESLADAKNQARHGKGDDEK